MDVRQYLERIGIAQIETPTYAFLAQLQWRHVCAVPFENLDLIHGRPIVLDMSRLLDKIVNRRRGGFCYELNGCFSWLLKRLGFSVTLIAAGVYNANRDEFGPQYDHMALLVQLEQLYLVDVGFGDSARQPIRLPDGKVDDVSGRYRVQPSSNDDHRFLLQRYQAGWQPQYRFTTEPQRLEEYQGRCDYFQTSPDSHFRQGVICSQATEEGRISLTEQQLLLTVGGSKKRLRMDSSEMVEQMLERYFGLHLNGPI